MLSSRFLVVWTSLIFGITQHARSTVVPVPIFNASDLLNETMPSGPALLTMVDFEQKVREGRGDFLRRYPDGQLLSAWAFYQRHPPQLLIKEIELEFVVHQQLIATLSNVDRRGQWKIQQYQRVPYVSSPFTLDQVSLTLNGALNLVVSEGYHNPWTTVALSKLTTAVAGLAHDELAYHFLEMREDRSDTYCYVGVSTEIISCGLSSTAVETQ